MKKLLATTLAAIMAMGTVAFGAESIPVTKNPITVYVNGQAVVADNFIYDGTTYLPIRAIGDSLGAKIDYDAVNKTAKITTEQTSKDVLMSNFVIYLSLSSDLSHRAFLLKDNVDTMFTVQDRQQAVDDLKSDIADLRGQIDFIKTCNIEPLYGITDTAENILKEAEICLPIAEKGAKGNSLTNDEMEQVASADFAIYNSLIEMLNQIHTINADSLNYAINGELPE